MESGSSSSSPSANPSQAPQAVESTGAEGDTQGNSNRGSASSRSCLTCYRRKVRCDKGTPCSNCARANAWCNYPDSRSYGPRKPRAKNSTPPLAEILSRLQLLEAKLAMTAGPQQPAHSTHQDALDVPTESESSSNLNLDSRDRRPPPFRGDMILKDGSVSSYYSDSFVASLVEETETVSMTPEYRDSTSPSDTAYNTEVSAISTGTPASALLPLMDCFRPGSSQGVQLWLTYLNNVDPIIKILHIPTVEKDVYAAISTFESASLDTALLLYSIYYAAVTSLDSNYVSCIFGLDKLAVLKQLRQGVDAALGRLNILANPNLRAMQAITIFLTTVRVHDTSRAIWNLTGLAIRIGYSLGLHRDGTQLGLSPFQTELRRRLWWHMYCLDLRSHEDHGVTTTLLDTSTTTKFPLHINDSDLSPDMPLPPKPRTRWTQMSFSLVRIEQIWGMFVKIMKVKDLRPGIHIDEEIEEIRSRVSQSYLGMATDGLPTQRAAIHMLNHALDKARFVVYLHAHNASPDDPEIAEKSLLQACQIVEQVLHSIHESDMTHHLSWIDRTYTQWYAITFIYRRLSSQSTGHIAQRAWDLAERFFSVLREDNAYNTRGPMWLAVIRLRQKALEVYKVNDSAREAATSPVLLALDEPMEQELPLTGINEFDFDTFMADDFASTGLFTWSMS